MIVKLDNEETELNCQILIHFRPDRWGPNNENWGIQINSKITPLYCCNCQNQLSNLFHIDGGRYGHVGTIKCSCEAEINCTDSDNIVEYLNTSSYFDEKKVGELLIDFKSLYQLNNESIQVISDEINMNIFEVFNGKRIDLEELVGFVIENSQLKIQGDYSLPNEKFTKLPKKVNNWLELLNNTSANKT